MKFNENILAATIYLLKYHKSWYISRSSSHFHEAESYWLRTDGQDIYLFSFNKSDIESRIKLWKSLDNNRKKLLGV